MPPIALVCAFLGQTNVYSAILPSLEFELGVYVNYAEASLRMRYGVPKMKDFSSELGDPEKRWLERSRLEEGGGPNQRSN